MRTKVVGALGALSLGFFSGCTRTPATTASPSASATARASAAASASASGAPSATASVAPSATASVAPSATASASATAAPSAAPVVAPPEAQRACTALLARARSQLARVPEPLRRPIAALQCMPTTQGMWAFDVRSVQSAPSGYEDALPVFTIVAQPVFVRDENTIVRGAPVTLKAGGRFEHEVRFEHAQVADLDGDGLGELVVQELHSQEESPRAAEETRWLLLRVQGNSLVDATPPRARVYDVEDVDVDGHVDLVLASEFRTTNSCGIDSWQEQGPRRVLHAQRNGGFSDTDAAAVAYLRDQCRTRPARFFVEPPEAPVRAGTPTSVVETIACARWCGMSPEVIATALARETSGDASLPNANCYELPALRALAATALPVTLDLRCQ